MSAAIPGQSNDVSTAGSKTIGLSLINDNRSPQR